MEKFKSNPDLDRVINSFFEMILVQAMINEDFFEMLEQFLAIKSFPEYAMDYK